MESWCGGAEKSEDGKVTIVNESETSLEDTFDHQLRNLIEPLPSGIEFKTVKDDAGSECLVIFIPRSDLAPHRVGDWNMDDKKRILGRYYGRSGTSSVPLPENIVRAMYLSRGRVPRVSVYTEVNIPNVNKIQLKTIVEPDPQQYISQYYNNNQIAIIGSSLNVLPDTDGRLWRNIRSVSPDSPIYPKSEPYELLISTILNSKEDSAKQTMEELSELARSLRLMDVQFSQIYAIATKSNFSCDNVPLVTRTRLYILDIPEHRHLNGYSLTRATDLIRIEKKFDVEIYIAATFHKHIQDDGDAYFWGFDNNLHTSHIEKLLENLTSNSHD